MATPPPPPKRLCGCSLLDLSLCGRSLLDLPGDLIPEILLRVPPHDPGRLVRCSAVCKPWRRLLTDPAFLRRYRAFHGAPPMLGLLFHQEFAITGFLTRFAPTTSFRPRAVDHAGCYVRDARHGRVLLRNITGEENEHMLFVWSPVTDERWGLTLPGADTYWHVAVLCAAAAREGACDCDHHDCHGGPFLVVFVDTDDDWMTYALVYSSETGDWSDATYAPHPNELGTYMDMMDPIALVGNRMYFPAAQSKTIVEFDLGRRELAFVEPPSAHQGHGILMPAIGGGLGFASVRGSRLYLWSREIGSDRTAAAWTQSRVLEFSTPTDRQTRVPLNQPTALGFAEILMKGDATAISFVEGLGIIFVSTSAGLFAIKLRSGQVKKISSKRPKDCVIVPYMSFYTPDHATGCT